VLCRPPDFVHLNYYQLAKLLPQRGGFALQGLGPLSVVLGSLLGVSERESRSRSCSFMPAA